MTSGMMDKAQFCLVCGVTTAHGALCKSCGDTAGAIRRIRRLALATVCSAAFLLIAGLLSQTVPATLQNGHNVRRNPERMARSSPQQAAPEKTLPIPPRPTAMISAPALPPQAASSLPSARSLADQAAKARAEREARAAERMVKEIGIAVHGYIHHPARHPLSVKQAIVVKAALRDRCQTALFHCDRAIALDSRNALAWNQKIRALLYLSRKEEAHAILAKALAMCPDDRHLKRTETMIAGRRKAGR